MMSLTPDRREILGIYVIHVLFKRSYTSPQIIPYISANAKLHHLTGINNIGIAVKDVYFHQIRVLCFNIQSTLVIWKSKGPSKTLRDIRTSTYQT